MTDEINDGGAAFPTGNTPDPCDAVIARLVEAAESLRSKHDYIMRGCTWSITHMQIAGEFDAAIAAAKEVLHG